ncbi:hypothetical protein CRYUN_Cryun01aG0136500 [Craigia yunnanensis]
MCVLYTLLDSQFITDITKYISGCMASLSAMVQLELPHVNVLSKMDLVTNKRDVENYLDPEPQHLLSELNERMAPRFKKLNKSLIELVRYLAIQDPISTFWSIQYVLAQIDNCIQYGEDADANIRDFDPEDDE